MPEAPQESYFSSHFGGDKERIAEIDASLEQIWNTLQATYKDGAWPYEIQHGEPLSTGEPSLSTATMVLYALLAGQGVVSARSFFPGPAGIATAPHPSFLPALSLKALANGILPYLKNDTVLNASSLGTANPFTLTWAFSSLIGASVELPSLIESVEEDQLATLCKSALIAVSRLDSCPFKPNQLLAPRKGTAAAHAFPALRTVQLQQILSYLAMKLDATNHLMAKLKMCPDWAPLETKVRTLAEKSIALQQWFLARVHEQLANSSVCDAPFDAAELAFSIEGVVLLAQDPNANCNSDTDLLNHVFQILEDRQQLNPYWRPLRPMITQSNGQALLPLSVEIVNSLFRSCHLLGRRGQAMFSRHFGIFRRYYEWIFARRTQGTFNDSGNLKLFYGWHSEHLQQAGVIHIWETSQVAIYLMLYKAMLQEFVAKKCLTAARLAAKEISRDPGATSLPPVTYWKTKVEINDPSPDLNIYKEIGEYFISSRQGGSPDEQGVSALLYGPPGTGKTTLAEEIAKSLGWGYIEITPSDFVANGESAVEQRAKEIFLALNQQRNLVILFDEIDRLILDRDSVAYGRQGDMFQVMTPGMLPKIRELRKANCCIFIIATNFKERLDPAAVRIGRVDRQWHIGLPNLSARKRILADLLGDGIRRVKKAKLYKDRAFTTETTIEEHDVELAAKHTALASFGDLKATVADALVRLGPNPKRVIKDDLLSQFNNQIEKSFVPSVKLGSYKTRFHYSYDNNPNVCPTTQEPTTEFVRLLGLACESDESLERLDPTDKSTATQVLTRLCSASGVKVPGTADFRVEFSSSLRMLADKPAFSLLSNDLLRISTKTEKWLLVGGA